MDEIKQLKEAEQEIELAYDELDEASAATASADPALAANVRGHKPARHHKSGGGNVTAGLILIAIGSIFLLTNVFDFTFHNWWALFILIPAFSNFGQAMRAYQRHGRFTRSVRGSLTGGAILSLIAAAFLFSWDWGLIWPVFLIVGGISALLGGWFE